MSDWLGVLLSVLVIFVPLGLAWRLLGRNASSQQRDRGAWRGKMRR